MKSKILLFVVMLLSIIRLSIAQDKLPTSTPTSPPYPFPYLYCPHVISGVGGTWRGITIGKSTLEDVYILMAELSDSYIIIDEPADEGILFDHPSNREAYEMDIPAQLLVCNQENTVTALQYLEGVALGSEPKLFLDDLVAEYGVPDMVTWDNTSISRSVFWFEAGVAADVLVTEPFGSVISVVYFPFQPVKGYEDRWPFNQTRTKPLEHPEGGKQPPSEQNPFDYKAIQAKLTAQPSPTVTPTATP